MAEVTNGVFATNDLGSLKSARVAAASFRRACVCSFELLLRRLDNESFTLKILLWLAVLPKPTMTRVAARTAAPAIATNFP